MNISEELSTAVKSTMWITPIILLISVKSIVVLFLICYRITTSKSGQVFSNNDCPLRFKDASEFQGESAIDFNFDEN